MDQVKVKEDEPAALKSEPGKKPRKRPDPPKKMTFAELGLRRLKPPKVGQTVYWDTGTKGQLGLSVLVSSGGTKTYRATYLWPNAKGTRNKKGKLIRTPVSVSIGRVGEIDLTTARDVTKEYRKKATAGLNPQVVQAQEDEAKAELAKAEQGILYETVVDQFIEHYAKPRQRTWDQTQRILKGTCKSFLKRPIAEITKGDARKLLRSFIADGHPYKAAVTRAWLKKLWRWAAEEDHVTTPIMDAVRIDYDRRERVRFYSDDEIKAIWHATNQLEETTERAYVKLLILLAPRKRELAWMTWSQLDDLASPTLWTTPFELTKSRKTSKKRVYLTPLPPLAQRIIKSLPKKRDANARVFPTLKRYLEKGGSRRVQDGDIKDRLIACGAPKGFTAHTCRHTIATFLENAGHSEWERGLILNHAGSGVTADYSHGYPAKLKLELLQQWAAHVEGLLQPAGVALLS